MANSTLTSEIKTTSGLKQGCVLAPILFNLYMADLGKALTGASLAPPKIGQTHLQILQYADNLVLIDHTKGLQRALAALHQYNLKNRLKLNINKTKVIIFGKYTHKSAAR